MSAAPTLSGRGQGRGGEGREGERGGPVLPPVHLVDGHVSGEVRVESVHHIPLGVVVGIVVGQREDL